MEENPCKSSNFTFLWILKSLIIIRNLDKKSYARDLFETAFQDTPLNKRRILSSADHTHASSSCSESLILSREKERIMKGGHRHWLQQDFVVRHLIQNTQLWRDETCWDCSEIAIIWTNDDRGPTLIAAHFWKINWKSRPWVLFR